MSNHATSFQRLRLRAARKYLGISQQQLADRLGVTARTVSSWERGATVPEDVAALAHILIVEVDWLFDSSPFESKKFGKD